MVVKLSIDVDIELVDEFDKENVIARVYYPDEGNKIQIKKGLDTITLSEAIFHEIGHVIDWYLSNGQQSSDVDIREQNADIIGECLRWKKSSTGETTNENNKH
jgi:hypothetical protein